jgi:hypothetical protein
MSVAGTRSSAERATSIADAKIVTGNGHCRMVRDVKWAGWVQRARRGHKEARRDQIGGLEGAG